MTEKFIDSFKKSLGTEQSSWSDYSLERASEVLGQFLVSDWHDLEVSVLSMPTYMQERCAEAVGATENSMSVPALTALLNSPSRLVASIAASELENMSISLPMQFESKLRSLLDYLNECQSPRSKDVQRLIESLAPPG